MQREGRTRMAELAGSPRIEPMGETSIPQRADDAIDRLSALHNHPRGKTLHGFYAMICRSPEIFASYLQFGSDISTESTLPPRARELAILRTGWLCGAPFQWGEHVRAAKVQLGLTAEDFARVREGSAAPGWSEGDRAVLAAAEELHARATLSDATWAALSEHLDERQCVELLFLAGHYHMTAFVQNALRVPLNPGNEGLAAE